MACTHCAIHRLVYFDGCQYCRHMVMIHFCLLPMYFGTWKNTVLSLHCLLVHPNVQQNITWRDTDLDYKIKRPQRISNTFFLLSPGGGTILGQTCVDTSYGSITIEETQISFIAMTPCQQTVCCWCLWVCLRWKRALVEVTDIQNSQRNISESEDLFRLLNDEESVVPKKSLWAAFIQMSHKLWNTFHF